MKLSFLNHVSAYIGQTCYVVHRLDMETSGLVLFAKNPFYPTHSQSFVEKKELLRVQAS